MTQPPEEIARRKAVMAEAGRRADKKLATVNAQRQAKLAEAIDKAIQEAPPAVSVDEAVEMLHAFEGVKGDQES